MEDTNTEELESFRRQWLEEVASRTKTSTKPQSPTAERPGPQPQAPGQGESDRQPPPPQYAPPRLDEQTESEEQTSSAAVALPSFERLAKDVRSMSIAAEPEDTLIRDPRPDPTSALEHFEQAAQNEDEGNLGDSLDLYRKAYRLDSKVDQTYRRKHFPPSVLQIAGANPSNASTTVPNTHHHSSEAAPAVPTPELVASFARLRIPVAEPIIENMPPPPCPISNVPSEVLAAILKQVALLDPASLSRVALVCRRLAYHVSHDQHIWRRLCQGPEFGFASMHYSFACDVEGNRLYTLKARYTPFPFGSAAFLQIPKPLMTWSQVFQAFPRIRFTGIYISTVNYTRTGMTTFQGSSRSSPIHIVTYYRYLRFYPDGSLISLLGTTKPVDVVPYISKESLDIVKDGVPAINRHQQHSSLHHPHPHQPSSSSPATSAEAPGQQSSGNPVPPAAASALKKAVRGRWRLAKPLSAETESETDADSSSLEVGPSSMEPPPPPPSTFRSSSGIPRGDKYVPTSSNSAQDTGPDLHDLLVETEGADQKYTYTMHLVLRSSVAGNPSNSSKNTKLAWKGFWSYNHLTDDWAEFGLRNDRAFVFRRVRGWGTS